MDNGLSGHRGACLFGKCMAYGTLAHEVNIEMPTRLSIASLLPLLLVLSDCAAQQQDSHEARMRARQESPAASPQQFVDQQKAEAKGQIADDDQRTETWKSPFQAYADCNRRAAQAVATKTGDPTSLAVAARNRCRMAETTLRKEVYAANEDNPEVGTDTMEKLRGAILQDNASYIVAARGGASTLPRRLPEPENPPVDREHKGRP